LTESESVFSSICNLNNLFGLFLNRLLCQSKFKMAADIIRKGGGGGGIQMCHWNGLTHFAFNIWLGYTQLLSSF